MSPSLMPHAVRWSQDPQVIWTMVITNGITFLSYFGICLTLFYLARRTREVVRREWAFFLIAFGLFIVACGTTHLMEVVTTWVPVFWIAAWTNIVTAILSAYVAIEFLGKVRELGFGINDYAARLKNAESERAKAEDGLLAARKLEEWNRMSAVVTHEINNPLAAIGNLLFLMQVTPGITPELAGLVHQSQEEVRRIESLTRSTLGFFRQAKEPESVDLISSLEDVRFLLGPTLRQRGIEFEVSHQGDCRVFAFGVETRQVLLNLVRNAIEATERRGAKVSINLEGRREDVRVAVADQGSGISPEVMPRLFQFGATTKGDRGNGMGLWLVKQLVARHGGRIEVQSSPGEGACFTVFWPRRMPAQGAGEEIPRREPGRKAS
jgi:signal transduction histidine kinase